MQKTFIGLLLLILILILFALENQSPIKISFWFREIDANLSLVIILSITLGAVVSFLLSLPAKTKKNKVIREKDEKINLLEKETINLIEKLKNPEQENPGNKRSDNDTKKGDYRII